MRIQFIQDLLIIIDKYYDYLSEKNINFDENGFPIFQKEMFLTEWPNLVVPYSQRKNRRVVDRSKTVICFFDKDKNLYPRLAKVLLEIEEYKQFMGVVGLDITITNNMDREWKEITALINQLFIAVLAVNDIKIIINTRNGDIQPEYIFKNVPSGIMAASGFLGCNRIFYDYDLLYLKKILNLLPEKLIIYGKHDKKAESQLDVMGINYRVFPDFHRLCKGG